MRNLTLLFLCIHFSIQAQTAQGLVAWLSADKPGCQLVDEFGDPSVVALPPEVSGCACGVRDSAYVFNGIDDFFFLTGTKVDNALGAVDFTLSFYFKANADNSPDPQVLFSKQNGCSTDSSFSIKYLPATRRLAVELTENSTISGSIFETLPVSCWYHVAVVRKSGSTILYINGEEVKRVNTINGQRVSISKENEMLVGKSDCNTDAFFDGLIDEIRLYNRALDRNEVEDLYFSPDQIQTGLNSIGTKDTTIFLGNAVQVRLTHTCATTFNWLPAAGVNNTTAAEPVITPLITTTYAVNMDDNQCVATDSLRIVVVDPSTIDCSDIFLPTAFTPNDDGLNDGFGISNPFATGELLAFDIYDRWGNIVFSTTDPLVKWDGSYKGSAVNPGVFLYRIQYRCEGEEGVKSGSVTVIR